MQRISFDELLKDFTAIDPVEVTAKIVMDNPEEIIENVQDQLYNTGTNEHGSQFKGYKQPAYANKKHRMNPRPGYGVPDFKVSGDMYLNMQLGYDTADSYKIISNVPYFKRLEKRDGSQAFDMNEDSKHDFRRAVLFPELRKEYAQRLGLRLK